MIKEQGQCLQLKKQQSDMEFSSDHNIFSFDIIWLLKVRNNENSSLVLCAIKTLGLGEERWLDRECLEDTKWSLTQDKQIVVEKRGEDRKGEEENKGERIMSYN